MAQDSLLQVNPGLIIWTVVTFLILLVLLKKFVWGPVIAAVDRREESLKEMFDSAEKSKDEAKELLEKYEQQLAEAREEVNRMIDDGKSRAKKTADEIVEKARRESVDMSEKAKAEIVRERDKATAEIRDDVVRISLKAAEQLISKTLGDTEHREFIEKAIAEIDEEVK
jgi:F-type H+-transporting ATPase subunit b